VAHRPGARYAVRARRRRDRAPRLESIQRPRPGLPALVRRSARDLLPRTTPQELARGLSATGWSAHVCGHLGCVRSRDGADLVVPVPPDPVADRSSQCRRWLRGRADARVGARVRASCTHRALARGRSRLGERLVRRVPCDLRSHLRQPPRRTSDLRPRRCRARSGSGRRGSLCLALCRASAT
jgi:hypothetical protein